MKKKIKLLMTDDNDLQKFIRCDVFTPDDICKIMANKLNSYGNLLEPSVGTGNLLKFIDYDDYESIDVYELKSEYLGAIPMSEKLNIYNCDFIKIPVDVEYDNIIMNPPYIKMQDLSVEYRKYLKNTFHVLKDGIIDIYYAFIIKCLNLLKPSGVMVAITPNSYLYNKSSLNLRKYLFDNGYIKEIIDFKDKKVFKRASVYCCITVFTKKRNDYLIYNNEKIAYSDINKKYSLFDIDDDNKYTTLRDICKIKNGIATLRDKIYIHENKLYDEPCWKKITTATKDKYIIYPYNDGIIIEEDIFKEYNPKTYRYLLSNKEELSKRDKGKKKYPTWYSFGRTQAIRYTNKNCVYISCFLDPKSIKDNIFVNKNVLHSSCLCIEPNDEIDIQKIVNALITNVDFIENNSSKRSGGWINISSRTLYNVKLE